MYRQEYKIHENIITDNDLLFKSNHFLQNYYDRFIRGLNYEELQRKAEFFSPF